jgi:hypothetical protein
VTGHDFPQLLCVLACDFQEGRIGEMARLHFAAMSVVRMSGG